MTPQSHFNVVARVAPGRERALRALLATMNGASGSADPANAVLPFGAFEELHFARLVLVDDALMNDLRVHGVEPPRLPTCLALLGECDGPARDCLAAMASRAAAGLRTLFAHCDGFDAGGDLLAWLLAHNRPVAAMYVNRIGRTVRQVREEHALWQALAQRAPRAPVASAGEAQQRRRELVEWVGAEVRAGRLRLTPPAPTPLAWRIANLGHALGVPLVGVLLAPLAMVLLPVAIVLLRRHERRDPEYCPPPDPAALRTLQDIEDHDLTNQFSATGPVKPGAFRRLLLTLLLVAIDWACRHVFGRGHLARVQTIHFARWVLLDGGARVLFASSYDGGHEAYMDDFVNKVGWGMNLVFSNGVGWPRTDWLILRGARREQAFKRYQRRHQIPSQVWYKAYPGLTLTDLDRACRIRAGLDAADPSDAQAVAWLRMI